MGLDKRAWSVMDGWLVYQGAESRGLDKDQQGWKTGEAEFQVQKEAMKNPHVLSC